MVTIISALAHLELDQLSERTRATIVVITSP